MEIILHSNETEWIIDIIRKDTLTLTCIPRGRAQLFTSQWSASKWCNKTWKTDNYLIINFTTKYSSEIHHCHQRRKLWHNQNLVFGWWSVATHGTRILYPTGSQETALTHDNAMHKLRKSVTDVLWSMQLQVYRVATPCMIDLLHKQRILECFYASYLVFANNKHVVDMFMLHSGQVCGRKFHWTPFSNSYRS